MGNFDKTVQMLMNEVKAGYKFEQKTKKNTKTKEDELQDIVVQLEGVESGIATNLAKKIRRLQSWGERVSKLKETVQEECKSLDLDIFEDKDMIYTRVVETASALLTFGKLEDKTKDVELTDPEKVRKAFAEIRDLLKETLFGEQLPILMEAIDAIEKTAIEVKQDTVKAKRNIPRIKFKEKGRIEESTAGDVWAGLKKSVKLLVKTLKGTLSDLLKKYDRGNRKIAALVKKAQALVEKG